MKKRDKLQVVYDILRVIEEKNGKIKPTHILYKSNLSHQMMEEYLNELILKKFVIENTSEQGKTYRLTQKGLEYIDKYKVINEFIQHFSLNEE